MAPGVLIFLGLKGKIVDSRAVSHIDPAAT